MRRLVLALAVTLGLLVLTPSPSWACSCAMATTAEHVRDAVTVAAGTVDWTASDGQTRSFRVDVDGVYKGAAATSEKLVTNANEASCGVGDLATGKRYLFFIEGRHPGVMRIGLCGGTVAYDDATAREIASVTGPPGAPLAVPGNAADEAPPSTGDHTGLVLGAGAVVLLVAAAGALLVRRRARA